MIPYGMIREWFEKDCGTKFVYIAFPIPFFAEMESDVG